MTKVEIDSGICGLVSVVTAEKGKDKKVHITVETPCEMVKKMADEIELLEMMSAFTGHLNNPVYRAAAKHLKHVACPAPAGILKALEVELGLCLPKDCSIRFLKDK
jgi:pentose-5-phosphate-3-epimerase